MTEMTAKQLAVWLCDQFHDWIDGDDYPIDYKHQVVAGHEVIVVKFNSKRTFSIRIREVKN